MFSAVVELEPSSGIGAEQETSDAVGHVAHAAHLASPSSEQLEVLELLAQVTNDNGRRR